MQAGRKNAQQTITWAAHEELDRDRVGRVLLILIGSVRAGLQGIHERSKVPMPCGIHEVRELGRQGHVVAVLFCQVVRRKKTSAGNQSVQCKEQGEPSCLCATHHHPVPLSLRILGSAQYRSRSARKLPASKNSVESKTPPITT